MSKVDWVVASTTTAGPFIVALNLSDVSTTIAFKFYLPENRKQFAKLVSLETDEQELAVGTLERSNFRNSLLTSHWNSVADASADSTSASRSESMFASWETFFACNIP